MSIEYIHTQLSNKGIKLTKERIRQIIRRNKLNLGKGIRAEIPLELCHLIIEYFEIKQRLSNYKEIGK